jgi:hypothetical protein
MLYAIVVDQGAAGPSNLAYSLSAMVSGENMIDDLRGDVHDCKT